MEELRNSISPIYHDEFDKMMVDFSKMLEPAKPEDQDLLTIKQRAAVAELQMKSNGTYSAALTLSVDGSRDITRLMKRAMKEVASIKHAKYTLKFVLVRSVDTVHNEKLRRELNAIHEELVRRNPTFIQIECDDLIGCLGALADDLGEYLCGFSCEKKCTRWERRDITVDEVYHTYLVHMSEKVTTTDPPTVEYSDPADKGDGSEMIYVRRGYVLLCMMRVPNGTGEQIHLDRLDDPMPKSDDL
jgi:hypothetical protein